MIPVAGLGTRFLPVTRSVPKALLPILGTPLIHYAVAEAAQCGIEKVVLVISPGMESVGAYFDARPDLEAALEGGGRRALLERQQQIADMANVVMVTQPEPRGLGHAVYLAHQEIGAEHFAVILPDDFIKGRASALAQLLEIHDERGGSVLAARAVPDEVVPTKGIIDAEASGKARSPRTGFSRKAIAGRSAGESLDNRPIRSRSRGVRPLGPRDGRRRR